MDKTLRRLKGWKVDTDGTAISLQCETVEGLTVEMRVVPEAVMELVLNLMTARMEATVRAEGGVLGDPPKLGAPIRSYIPSRQAVCVPVDGNKRLVQVETDQGAVFEFLLPPEEGRKGS